MNKGFYSKLAADNIRKNSKTYIPYILTCIFTVAMYYMIKSLSLNESINNMIGAETIEYTLELGSNITAIFAFIFLFYTNSFLMKRRKKEFGLFNILGMEKRHISRILFFETLYVAFISFAGGFLIGIALDKLMYLIIAKILGGDITLGFYISHDAMIKALIIFGIIFICIFLNSLRQIHLAKPIELLKGGNVGEKEPKTKWIMAILGVLCLCIGYYIAVTTENPVAALSLFFVAVILVIAGTYLLFTAGSIAFLKLLRKNKRYYYKTKHFTTVSGMLYRMKQNAVGLANICILSTMVMVMVSTTTSLMIGIEDIIRTRYPWEITVDDSTADKNERELFTENIMRLVSERNVTVENEVSYEYLSFSAVKEGDRFFIPENANMSEINNLSLLFFVTVEDYNKNFGTDYSLDDGEILLCGKQDKYDYDEMQIFDKKFTVKKHVDKSFDNGFVSANIAAPFRIVVKDIDIIEQIYDLQKDIYGKNASTICSFYGLDVDADSETENNLYESINNMAKENSSDISVEYREAERSSALSLYGGLFFLGIFLGTMFIMATILIIYYKQISEGYEDKERFIIMQNVGMSKNEVKHSIHSQVLTVFFLPLIMTGIHLIFAFPIIEKILAMLMLTNTKLYIICTGCCFLVFALFYVIIYLLTAKTYFRIIKK